MGLVGLPFSFWNLSHGRWRWFQAGASTLCHTGDQHQRSYAGLLGSSMRVVSVTSLLYCQSSRPSSRDARMLWRRDILELRLIPSTQEQSTLNRVPIMNLPKHSVLCVCLLSPLIASVCPPSIERGARVFRITFRGPLPTQVLKICVIRNTCRTHWRPHSSPTSLQYSNCRYSNLSRRDSTVQPFVRFAGHSLHVVSRMSVSNQGKTTLKTIPRSQLPACIKETAKTPTEPLQGTLSKHNLTEQLTTHIVHVSCVNGFLR